VVDLKLLTILVTLNQKKLKNQNLIRKIEN